MSSGIGAASPRRRRCEEIDAGLTPLERRRWSRSDRIGDARGDRSASATPACSTAARIGRGSGSFLGAGTADLLRNEEFLSDLDYRGTPPDAAVGRLESFSPARRLTSSPSGSASKDRVTVWWRPVRRARLRSAVRRTRCGRRADAVLAGGTDALARLTFSGFNQLQADGSGALPAVRQEPRRHEHRRGRRDPGARESRSRHAPRRDDLRRAGGLRLGCEAFHPTAPEPEGRPVAAVIVAALADAGIDAGRGRSHQRAWHRDRCRTTPRRRAHSGACSASGRRRCRSRR